MCLPNPSCKFGLWQEAGWIAACGCPIYTWVWKWLLMFQCSGLKRGRYRFTWIRQLGIRLGALFVPVVHWVFSAGRASSGTCPFSVFWNVSAVHCSCLRPLAMDSFSNSCVSSLYTLRIGSICLWPGTLAFQCSVSDF